MSDFWDMVRRVAEPLRGKPTWMHAGIRLNPEHFVTYASSIETKMREKMTATTRTLSVGDRVAVVWNEWRGAVVSVDASRGHPYLVDFGGYCKFMGRDEVRWLSTERASGTSAEPDCA